MVQSSTCWQELVIKDGVLKQVSWGKTTAYVLNTFWCWSSWTQYTTQRTGHKSVEGLRTYEWVTEDQQKLVSKNLSGQSMNLFQLKMKAHLIVTLEMTMLSRLVLCLVNWNCMPTVYNNCNINFYSSAPPSPYPAMASCIHLHLQPISHNVLAATLATTSVSRVTVYQFWRAMNCTDLLLCYFVYHLHHPFIYPSIPFKKAHESISNFKRGHTICLWPHS